MNATSREEFRTINLSYTDLDTSLRLSFPDLVLPSVGARPLSLGDIRPIARARRVEAEVEARQIEPLEPLEPLDAPRPRSRGRLVVLFALLVLPSLGAVGGWLLSGNANVDELAVQVSRLASSATASMTKSLEGPTAAGVFE